MARTTILIAVIVSTFAFAETNHTLDTNALYRQAFNYYTFTNDFTNGYFRTLSVHKANTLASNIIWYEYTITERHTGFVVHRFGFTNASARSVTTNIVTKESIPVLQLLIIGGSCLALGFVGGVIVE